MSELVVTLSKVELSFKGEMVLKIPQLGIYQWERIGIVGGNGQGKTSLLRLIAGQIQPDQGEISRQQNFTYLNQVAAVEEKELRDYQLLSELSVPLTAIENLSGGEETRLKIAQIFGSYHEGLLLDEPTTHLDQEGIGVLLTQLENYYGTVVVVSHDRYFLDQVVNKIWEVADTHVTEYLGNYSAYEKQKEERALRTKREQQQHLRQTKALQNSIDTQAEKVKRLTHVSQKQKNRQIKPDRLAGTKEKGTVLKQAQKAVKKLEHRLEQLGMGPAVKESNPLSFPQSDALKIYNPFPIMADQLSLVHGERSLLQQVDFQVGLGQVIALVGPNGCGKSSLLQKIITHGEGLIISPKVVLATFGQRDYRFAKKQTLLTYLKSQSDYSETILRRTLKQLNFSQSDLTKKISDLSGGERTRLRLAEVFLKPSNVLILDEPTNFLDLPTIQALEQFILAYEGTVIFASHDQTFVKQVATEVWQFKDQQLSKSST